MRPMRWYEILWLKIQVQLGWVEVCKVDFEVQDEIRADATCRECGHRGDQHDSWGCLVFADGWMADSGWCCGCKGFVPRATPDKAVT